MSEMPFGVPVRGHREKRLYILRRVAFLPNLFFCFADRVNYRFAEQDDLTEREILSGEWVIK
jgi:hypothetical protein